MSMGILRRLFRGASAPRAESVGHIHAPNQQPLQKFTAVGYPKTGNTWSRILLGQYARIISNLDELPLFDSDKDCVPICSQQQLAVQGHFTHQPLTWQTQTAQHLTYDNTIWPFRGQCIVFIVRHPLDVVVSHYMHARFKVPGNCYSGALEQFVEDPVYGLDKLFEFHKLWYKHKGQMQKFFLWRYEDCIEDAETQLSHLLSFLGATIDYQAVKEAVRYASFENLKTLETMGQRLVYKHSGLNAFGDGPKLHSDAFHIRKGKAGGYREYFSAKHLAVLEERVRREMPSFFGYI